MLQSRFISINPKRILLSLAFLFVLAVPLVLASNSPLPHQHIAATSAGDPDKPSSEMNHHIAGIFLIAIALSAASVKRFRSLTWLRWLSPVLFISAGLFLAAWSDDEIWPRGDLNWSWLLHHDAEARQHKLYALLLFTVGCVEAVQSTPKLRRSWLSVVFPLLGVVGGSALFFHQHSGHVMANAIARTGPSVVPHSGVAVQFTAGTAIASAAEHHHGSGPPGTSAEGLHKESSLTTGQTEHDPVSMENIKRQHAWFAFVGFSIALLKFLHDTAGPSARVRQYLWPASMVVLGALLLIYTE